jgi:imidazole glycerol-phosphate synthase subunit HisH
MDPIAIVDYGMGNLGSVRNMLRRIGVSSTITGDPAQIEEAKKVLLPGVGSFDAAMQQIETRGLREVLDQKALEERVPTLGICLGMQLITRGSEEGTHPGLGWIEADVRRFPLDIGLKVPHMGWNLTTPTRTSALTEGLPDESRFYFVHSYYVLADDRDQAVLTTEYGVTFDAALEAGNIYGAQFHPEKSHRFGMQVLANFARI